MRAGAREVSLIVLGILIAFALDAAWDARARRLAEHDLLAALQDEMEFNLQALDEADSVRATALEAARDLFALCGPEVEGRPFGEIEALLLRIAAGATTLEPRTGTVNSIIQAGKLDLIRSETLRSALASWHEQLRDLREEEDRNIEYLLNRFWTYLEGRVVLVAGGTQWEGAFDASTAEELLRDPRFATHVGQQMHRIRLTMDDASDLRALIREILTRARGAADWSQS